MQAICGAISAICGAISAICMMVHEEMNVGKCLVQLLIMNHFLLSSWRDTYYAWHAHRRYQRSRHGLGGKTSTRGFEFRRRHPSARIKIHIVFSRYYTCKNLGRLTSSGNSKYSAVWSVGLFLLFFNKAPKILKILDSGSTYALFDKFTSFQWLICYIYDLRPKFKRKFVWAEPREHIRSYLCAVNYFHCIHCRD